MLTGREHVLSDGEHSWASLLLCDDCFALSLLFLLFFSGVTACLGVYDEPASRFYKHVMNGDELGK